MQVQSPYQYHAHPPANHKPTHANGVHLNSGPPYQAPTNGHSNGESMNPYQQQQYAGGHGAPQQRQYPANQLPPMYPNMNMSAPPGPSMAGPSTAQQPAVYHPAPPADPPSTLAGRSNARSEEERPLSFVGNNGKYKYELKVEQQPMRARMCGFGDKDRRPITPPPCIRLVISDMHTGQPVSVEQTEGNNFFILQVDLWDDSAAREVNIVRSSSSSPAVSISTATTTSFPPTPDRPNVPDYNQAIGYDGHPVFQPQPAYAHSMGRLYANSSYYQPPFPGAPGPGYPGMPGTGQHQSEKQSMFTRNLIGSVTVNSATLKDPDNNLGYWFVLQDLSVRTEGWFRLKMQFINVGNANGNGLNRGKTPVLAYVFSDKFQVYSAKKFPGVIESTSLSKCFAGQGIKIPIRKDVKTEKDGDDDD